MKTVRKGGRHCKCRQTLWYCKCRRTFRTITLLFLFGLIVCFCSCGGGKKTPSDTLVVATSSWTAAYAQAAGAENVVVLAPFNMAHPSEYELRPGDIPKLMNATVIVYAGYEVMTEQLQKGLDLSPDKLCLISTEYSYETIAQSVMELAFRLGTENIARENLLEIRGVFDEGKKTVKEKKMEGQRVVVHRFQSSLARELGLEPVVIFGPATPEVSEIAAVSKVNAFLILDNRHNPVGQPFREVIPYALYKQLLNFPGHLGTKTLSDVIRYNVSQIVHD